MSLLLKRPPVILGVLLSSSFSAALYAQAPDIPIRSDVREVLLDVIVRQKNMKPARKLRRSDFTVTEDGKPQTIKTFRFVTEAATRETPQPVSTPADQSRPAAAAAPQRIQEPSFVSVVFDDISPDSRKYARDAVRSFLQTELNASTYVGIFVLNYRMDVLQSFTNDRAKLLSAVDQAAVGHYSSLARDNATVLNQTDYSLSSGPGGVSISSSVDLKQTRSLGTAGADTAIDEGAQAAAKIISDQREIAMYQGGMRTVMALMNLVKYEAALPGRKTVLYLSEGLNLPPDQHRLIQNVISSANRGNISFYGIDVRGLTGEDSDALAVNLANTAAASSAAQHTRPIMVTEGLAKQDEKILEMTVSNVQQNMDELARGTGGFLIANTNEINKAMQRVMDDVRTHYEISYVPDSKIYDGHFRKVQVSVTNPKLSVQSRDGYYALPDLNGKPVLPFELPGLRALDSKPAPHAFPFRVAAMQFRPSNEGFSYEIAFATPIDQLTPASTKAGAKARIHASFVALIKNSAGEVEQKVSREIDQEVPLDKIDQFDKGEVSFTAPVFLAPGRYTMEAAAIDPEGSRASTKRVVLVVPRRAKFALSDLALVHNLHPLPGARDLGDPLQFSRGAITPELDDKVDSTTDTSLYFVAYPNEELGNATVIVRFFRDGTEIARSEPALGDPDEIHSVPIIASAKLPPGDYQAQVTLQQGGRAIRRLLAFQVAEP